MGDTVLDTTSYTGSAGTDTPASSGHAPEPASTGAVPPAAGDAAPASSGANPEATGAGQEPHAADPGAGAAESVTSAAGWDTRGAEPGDDAAGPDTRAAEHGSSDADPAAAGTGTDPEISSAGPAGDAEHLPAPEAASGEAAASLPSSIPSSSDLPSSVPSSSNDTEPAAPATAGQGEADETQASGTAWSTPWIKTGHADSALSESAQPESAQAEPPLTEHPQTETSLTESARAGTPLTGTVTTEASRTGEPHGPATHSPAASTPAPVASTPKAASSWGPDTVTPLFDALGHARLPDTGVDDIQFPETISVSPDDEQTDEDEPATTESGTGTSGSGTDEEAPFGQMPVMEERGEELVNFQPRTPGESPLDDGSDAGRATVKILEEGNPDGELVVANPAIAQLITAHFLGAAAGPLALGATATGEFGLRLV